MMTAKIKLKPSHIAQHNLINELALLSAIKRRSSPKFKELKKELFNEQKNICFGSLCNGKIHIIDLFPKNRNECKKCRSRRACDSYKRNNGTSSQRTIYLLKFGKSCQQCDCSDPLMLEFDHLDPNTKIDCISQLESSKKILAEVGKTRILCLWHHRLHTKTQIGSASATHNKDFINGVKLAIGQCQICDRIVTPETTCCFDFDHIEPSEKVINISRMIGNHSSFEKIIEEISKCIFACCFCHRQRTAEQFNYPKHHKIKIKLKKEILPSQCIDCGIQIDRAATRCRPCYGKTLRAVENRPSLEQIYKDREELGSYVKVGQKYGVCDSTIRNWIEFYMRSNSIKQQPLIKLKLKKEMLMKPLIKLKLKKEMLMKPLIKLKFKKEMPMKPLIKLKFKKIEKMPKIQLRLQSQPQPTDNIFVFKLSYKNQCLDCGIQIYREATRCAPCYQKTNRIVIDRPSLEQINIDLTELGSFVQVGKKYGVSDNAIRKWIKTYQKLK